MPFRKKSTYGRKKPFTRRRKRMPKKNLMFKRTGGPLKVPRDVIPRSLIVKLPYDAGSISGQTDNTVINTQYYSNNIFDPQVATGGGQPMGFDQWSALYLNYRVHGVGIEVLCDNAGFHGGVVGIYPHSSNIVPSTLGHFMEFGESKYVTCNNGSRPYTLRKYLRNHALFGVSKREYNDDERFASGVGSGPSKLGYVNIFRQAIDEQTITNFDIRVKLTYYVEFYGVRMLSQS